MMNNMTRKKDLRLAIEEWEKKDRIYYDCPPGAQRRLWNECHAAWEEVKRRVVRCSLDDLVFLGKDHLETANAAIRQVMEERRV